MKFFKPVLIIFTLAALTYVLSANKVSLNKNVSKVTEASQPTALPVHGDLLFAFTAIASLGGYLVFKK